jgi:hypothetical protein
MSFQVRREEEASARSAAGEQPMLLSQQQGRQSEQNGRKMVGEMPQAPARPASEWTETVCVLSKSETAALFQRACQVFMSKKDQRSFDAVYQVCHPPHH